LDSGVVSGKEGGSGLNTESKEPTDIGNFQRRLAIIKVTAASGRERLIHAKILEVVVAKPCRQTTNKQQDVPTIAHRMTDHISLDLCGLPVSA
jgi:hypothetical protein